MSYIMHTSDGSFCTVCQAALSQEEADFECCGCCGGDGIRGDDDDFDPVNLAGSGPVPIEPREG